MTPGLSTGTSRRHRLSDSGYRPGLRGRGQLSQLKASRSSSANRDPDGCAACPSSIYPQNGYRNGTLYASYTAASFARKYDLAERHGVNFEGAVTWAFEFEGQPFFAGFRVSRPMASPCPC